MADIHGAVPQLHDYVEHAARVLGDKVALVRAKERLTFRAIDRRANHLAHVLVERGVERGDRVIVFGDNTVDTVVAFWAVLKANAVVSIVNPLTKADKLEYYLKDCRASCLITDEHLRNVWQAPARQLAVPEGARSSGPTDRATCRRERRGAAAAPRPRHRPRGASSTPRARPAIPKGVMLTHRNMLTAATSITTYLRERRGRRHPRRAAAGVRLRALPDDHGVPRRRAAGARAVVRVPGAGPEGDGRREASPAFPACRRSSPSSPS